MPLSRMHVVLDTLLPHHTQTSLPYGLYEAGFDRFYLDFTQTANASLRQSFHLALFIAIWVSPLLIRRLPPITRYPREIREQALAAMETSPTYLLRQMMLILKIVASLCYGANREVRDAMGYPRQHDDPRNVPAQRKSP